ncbi:hypothetical protein NLM31_07925 [Bradyrhizobium sp. CCGUVB4N]|uniref:S1/P1 nuclease n=1 Tax=Bradyrhizobium sp. CCGUVB4N TaxID=2949631 RepID=UPI0020B423B1|nr:S1/P1 nuclease [Bradyrhizobium sp. CCGUVB4N]MCP3380310.1 hypothetical protein [Bradyrhizobium sp. CCGUVB4N]
MVETFPFNSGRAMSEKEVMEAPQYSIYRPVRHPVIAELAQRHLSTAAQGKPKELIRDTSLAAISRDDYKFTSERKTNYRWHLVDIDFERSTYEAALDCKDMNNQGTCIVQGLPAAIAILKDKSSSKGDRLRGLKLVVHLAGDLEQPLHASERTVEAVRRRRESESWHQ